MKRIKSWALSLSLLFSTIPAAFASGITVPVAVDEKTDCGTLPRREQVLAPGETSGEQRTLINFTNDPSTPFTLEQVRAEVLDTANPLSAASYIDEVSYGRAWLTGDVMDWYSLPWDDLGICLIAYGGQTQWVRRTKRVLDRTPEYSIWQRSVTGGL